MYNNKNYFYNNNNIIGNNYYNNQNNLTSNIGNTMNNLINTSLYINQFNHRNNLPGNINNLNKNTYSINNNINNNKDNPIKIFPQNNQFYQNFQNNYLNQNINNKMSDFQINQNYNNNNSSNNNNNNLNNNINYNNNNSNFNNINANNNLNNYASFNNINFNKNNNNYFNNIPNLNNNYNFNNNFNNCNSTTINNNGFRNNGNFNNMNGFNNNYNFNNNNFKNFNNNTIVNFNNGNNFNNNINNFDKKILNSKTTITRPKGDDDIKINFMIRARGLQNVGATCYMNATLQCFYHVKLLTENLINDNNINSSMEITFCYKNLIEELAGCKNKRRFRINLENFDFEQKAKDYIKPNDFKNLIGKKNPLFKGIKANDSKDLIIFLLENMDNELTQRNNKDSKREVFYGKDLAQMEKENFKKIHNSILSELFYGFQKSTMKCLSCKNVDVTYNVINFLIFPLEKVYNSLNKNNNFNNNNMGNFNNYIMNSNFSNIYNSFLNQRGNMNNLNAKTTINFNHKRYNFNDNNNCNKNRNNIRRKLNLYDCFKENESKEQLSEQNQIHCNHCFRNSDAITQNQIYIAPNVLILIINRGKGNIFECDLDFPMELNISQYAKGSNSPYLYDLIGIISHFGESSMEGHFIAYCKHFDDNWYMFNDAIVKNVSIEDIYKGTPYILFYQNKNIKE